MIRWTIQYIKAYRHSGGFTWPFQATSSVSTSGCLCAYLGFGASRLFWTAGVKPSEHITLSPPPCVVPVHSLIVDGADKGVGSVVIESRRCLRSLGKAKTEGSTLCWLLLWFWRERRAMSRYLLQGLGLCFSFALGLIANTPTAFATATRKDFEGVRRLRHKSFISLRWGWKGFGPAVFVRI